MNAKLWNSNFWTTTLSKGYIGLQVYENIQEQVLNCSGNL